MYIFRSVKACLVSIYKTQSKIHIGMRYKGVIRPGGQATTMMPGAASWLGP